MALTPESVTLDGLALNDLTNYRLEGLRLPFGRKLPEWAEGADADGAALVRDPRFSNGEGEMRIRVEGATTMDAALAKVRAVARKLEEAEKQQGGIELVHRAGGRGGGSSKSLTFYVLSGEIEDVPITAEGEDAGYWFAFPVFTVKITAKPFGYGDWVQTITEDFSGATPVVSNFTFDTGSGTLTAPSGQVVPSDTTEKVLYRSAEGLRYVDAQVTMKFTTGATVPVSSIGLLLRRLDASNYLRFAVNPADGNVDIAKRDGGTVSVLATTTGSVLSTATAYWLRGRVAGNVLTVELFTAAPTPASTPLRTATYTLTGADATKFGAGIAGDVGLRTNSIPTDYRYDDFVIEPNYWKSSLPLMTGTVYNVDGDVPAEGRLIVHDAAGQSMRSLIWGIESRYFNPVTGLQLDPGSHLVDSGFAGSSTTRSGSYNTNVIRATLTTTPVAVCGLGNRGTVGTFRVYAGVYASSPAVKLRLSWLEGSGPLRSNVYATPPAEDAFVEVDLGLVTIPQAKLGTQRWTGQIEAYSETVGDTLDVDYVLLIPAGEGFGKARAPIVFETPTAFSARDEFDQSAGALSGKTLPVGGTWSGAGDADDFAVTGTGEVTRAATADGLRGRIALAGAATFTSTLVQVDFKSASVSAQSQGVIARYVDPNNYVTAVLDAFDAVDLIGYVAGVLTRFARVPLGFTPSADTYYTIRLVIDSAGAFAVWYYPQGSSSGGPQLIGQNSAFATGGALASGRTGFYDEYNFGTVFTRTYDNFLAAVPTVDAVIFSGQSAEVRHDAAIREDSTGTYYGPIHTYRGSRFLLPEAGDENRPSRVAVFARRNDIEASARSGATDATAVQIAYRPRFTAAPR